MFRNRKITVSTKLWFPYGKTIGSHVEIFYWLPDIIHVSNVYPQGTPKICMIRKFSSGFIVSDKYPTLRVPTLLQAVRLARKILRSG
jgi:hypothetical protein